MILKVNILEISSFVSLILICQVNGGEISPIQSLNDEASIDGNFHNINENSIDEDYHDSNAASIDEDYHNINEAYHNINAASIDEDYHNNLNSLSTSLNADEQFEEKRTIDITKKLKDLGNRITSFFTGDNERSYEESSNSFTEASSNPRMDNKKNMNEEIVDESRGSSQQNLSELTKKLTALDENSEKVRIDYKKNTNEADDIKRGNKNFDEQNNHIHDRYISPGGLKVDSDDLDLQDTYINAMPLLKQYLTMYSKSEPQSNFRSSSNPQMRPQHDHPGLKRIQGFIKSTNSQLMNGSLPGFRGDSQFLNTIGKKLKGFRYNME